MNKRVLVVDDSSTIRRIVLHALNELGCQDAVEAKDGNEALAAFQERPADLVIADWIMPNRSGLDLIEDIRRSGSQVPIFMITTEAEKKNVVAALQAGATDYLLKPFSSEALLEKLKKLLAV